MNLPNSISMEIDLNTELSNKKIGTSNNIDVLSIPTGVRAYLSVEHTKNPKDMYPIYTNATCELRKEFNFSEAQDIYLHTVGTSTETLKLNISVISKDKPSFLIKKNADTVGINEDVVQRLEAPTVTIPEATILRLEANPVQSVSNTFSVNCLVGQFTPVYDKTFTCDYIKLIVSPPTGLDSWGIAWIDLDGVRFSRAFGNLKVTDNGSDQPLQITIDNIAGKRLQIGGTVQNSNNLCFGLVTEYTY